MHLNDCLTRQFYYRLHCVLELMPQPHLGAAAVVLPDPHHDPEDVLLHQTEGDLIAYTSRLRHQLLEGHELHAQIHHVHASL